MDTDIFCALCGGPFDLEHHVYNIDTDREAFQWLYDVRLLSQHSTLGNLRMTTANEEHTNTSGSDDIFLSEQTRWAMNDGDCFRLGNSYYLAATEDHWRDIIFPLHYACIQIACRVLQSRHDVSEVCKPDEDSILARLYFRLQTWYLYHRGGQRNYIFGLRGTLDGYGPRSVQGLDELGWWSGAYEKYLTDPMNILELPSFVLDILQATPASIAQQPPSVQLVREPDGLENLPNELLDRIMEFLPSASIVSLHRTSRALSVKVLLNDRFWRKALLDSSIVHHIWDLDEDKLKQLAQGAEAISPDQGRWKSVVRLLKQKDFPICGQDSRLAELPKGLWNRCRIWNIVEDVLTTSKGWLNACRLAR
ncbi:hypothetical protein BU26DRAFT_604875 [Trematosphaeria pertusa]|uniref:F-box domain-containing protein n=1 Tax=Trematosphaeria pertusa TaxID=390896 RepID=A0A6A6IEB9_9PLEO|nr:uncharacterized protein BU26DRAFT_604875 [Trematosphaeria pertusa]KAF2248925.1 hypothetical protein BU26DRAFT_604875 [Trematosphaeria pertusa]